MPLTYEQWAEAGPQDAPDYRKRLAETVQAA